MNKILSLFFATTFTVISFSAPVHARELSDSKRTEIQNKIQEIKTKSQEKISALKTRAEEKTAEVKTKACEARKSNLATRLENRTDAAARHKTKFDEIKKRVDDFAAEKSLKSETIDQLNTKSVAAANAVSDEIYTLENLDVDIDCTNTDDLAIKLEAYKTEVSVVRESLKNYRESIRLYAQEVKKLYELGEGV